MTARLGLRAGLVVLTITQFGVGCWALLFPVSFFDIPVVGMGMAYNEHLMRDYGAMSLASSVVLGAAAITIQRTLAVVSLLGYLVWALAHFAIHVRLLHHLTSAQGTALLITLGAAIALTLTLLALTRRTPRELARPERELARPER